MSFVKKFLQLLFAMSIAAPSLGVNFGGFTVYPYLLIPLLDIQFLGYLVQEKHKTRTLISIGLVAGFCILLLHFDVLMRVLVLTYLVTYILYLLKSDSLFLRGALSIVVFVGILQFIGKTYFHVEILDPAAINRTIFGPNAKMEYGWRFADGYILRWRISGLSREPGFFSTLLLAGSFYSIKVFGLQSKRNLLFLGLMVLGLIISFSKITYFGVIALVTYVLLRDMKNSIFLSMVGFLVVLMVHFMAAHVMFNHASSLPSSIFTRMLGYFLLLRMPDASIVDWLFGIDLSADNFQRLTNLIPEIRYSEYIHSPVNAINGSGIATLFLHLGMLFTPFAFAFLAINRFHFLDVLVFMVLVGSSNPLTISSFCPLIYACMFLEKNHFKFKIHEEAS